MNQYNFIQNKLIKTKIQVIIVERYSVNINCRNINSPIQKKNSFYMQFIYFIGNGVPIRARYPVARRRK